MKIYDIEDDRGRTLAFEINNVWMSRRRFSRIVARIPGVTVTKRPRFFSWFAGDVFCYFELGGTKFEAEEPYGDNSRYWIGPRGVGINGKELELHSETEVIRAVFREL